MMVRNPDPGMKIQNESLNWMPALSRLTPAKINHFKIIILKIVFLPTEPPKLRLAAPQLSVRKQIDK